MSLANSHRFALLEGGLWLPGQLPAGDGLSRPQLVQAFAQHGERVQHALAANDFLRRLIELGFPLNLRPPGVLPTLPFAPLLCRSDEGVLALRTARGWMLQGAPGEWDDLLHRTPWTLALLVESAAQDWQAGLGLSGDDAEVEALSIPLARRKTLPLPGEHHLLMAGPRGPFLLTGPLVGTRLLTTSWEIEAVRLARAAVLGAWVPLPERRMLAMYRSALPDDVRVERIEQGWWRVWVDGTAVSLVMRERAWAVGRRQIPRSADQVPVQGEQPDRLTCLWAARAGTGQRARHFWRPARQDACLALARSQGVGLPESIAVYHLASRLACPVCQASLVVGSACLNSACPSRRGCDDDYDGVPLVYVQGGIFVYAPERPGWIEEKDGQIRGVVGDGLVQALALERVLVRQASDRTALLIARLMSFAEQPAPVEASLPLPAPSPGALEITRQVVQERAPFPSRFDETLRGLLG
jgi:hypothetical protein